MGGCASIPAGTGTAHDGSHPHSGAAPPPKRLPLLHDRRRVPLPIPYDVAILLDQLGIAVRSGHHCAQPLLRSLGQEYALRVSPAFYNTPEEIDALLDGLRRVLPLCTT